MQLLPKVAQLPNGNILFDTEQDKNGILELSSLNTRLIEKIRGSQIAMIFQEPMSSLNPVMTCGKQITESIQLHQQKDFFYRQKRNFRFI